MLSVVRIQPGGERLRTQEQEPGVLDRVRHSSTAAHDTALHEADMLVEAERNCVLHMALFCDAEM
jgi:hypothetical protein